MSVFSFVLVIPGNVFFFSASKYLKVIKFREIKYAQNLSIQKIREIKYTRKNIKKFK